ncbi:MAG: glycosyltransferase family 4 protein [Planctomycetaceae bacterium]
MNVCVVTEHRFYRTPDQTVWTDGPFARPFWDRYLDVFDEVRAIARVLPVQQCEPKWVRASGDRVEFASIPYYVGLYEFARKRSAVKQAVRDAVQPDDAVILRVPSTLANLLYPHLLRTGHPYAVEAVGDPYDVFAPGAIRHPLRPYLRWRLTRDMKAICRDSQVATYVTAAALQRRYPPGPDTESFYFSDVQLDGLIAPSPRTYIAKPGWTMITVGSLGHLYKAQDVQIAAIAACRQSGLNVRLQIAGEGKHRGELEQLAAELGVAEHVEFLGQLPAGPAIGAALEQADVFLLPSRQEGLPRALIEAMAKALPCIGSHVGGIPELLPEEDRVAASDVAALTAKIREFVTNPQRLERCSRRNLERTREFTEDVLRERRLSFYQSVRDHAPALTEKSSNVCLALT